MVVGTNTAKSTRVVATTAPAISCMALRMASLAFSPSSSIRRMVFSTTTMESSTTIPMASTSPNNVRLLMDSPIAFITTKVPMSETGMVTDGMSVVRKSCRKMKTVRMTRRMATRRVVITSLIEAWM